MGPVAEVVQALPVLEEVVQAKLVMEAPEHSLEEVLSLQEGRHRVALAVRQVLH